MRCAGTAGAVAADADVRLDNEQEDGLGNNYATVGYVNFLFGLFCANWAKNTNRSSWGWFFFGFFLAPIAGLVLVSKNK